MVAGPVTDRLEQYWYLGKLDLVTVIGPFLIIAAFAAGIWLSRKAGVPLRTALYIILGVGLMRGLLWGNPVAWLIYRTTLGALDIGYRQNAVMRNEVRKYFRPDVDITYLALGSSQTGAIYGQYARRRSDLYEIHLAGMGPVEFYLHRHFVEQFAPKVVLLYLSEYDMAKKPAYEAFRYVGRCDLNTIRYFRLILDHDRSQEVHDSLKALVVARFFPEYRYSFVQRGYLSKLIGHRPGADPAGATLALDGARRRSRQVDALQSGVSERHLALSIDALTWFLRYCQDRGVDVCIVEGQYNPVARNDILARLRVLSRQRLSGLASEFGNVSYIPEERTPKLVSGDFSDIMHVTTAIGLESSAAIIDWIERNGADDSEQL